MVLKDVRYALGTSRGDLQEHGVPVDRPTASSARSAKAGDIKSPPSVSCEHLGSWAHMCGPSTSAREPAATLSFYRYPSITKHLRSATTSLPAQTGRRGTDQREERVASNGPRLSVPIRSLSEAGCVDMSGRRGRGASWLPVAPSPHSRLGGRCRASWASERAYVRPLSSRPCPCCIRTRRHRHRGLPHDVLQGLSRCAGTSPARHGGCADGRATSGRVAGEGRTGGFRPGPVPQMAQCQC